MTGQRHLRTAILIAIALTLVGAGFSLLFPRATNYLLFPGMVIVYVLSGGVHGDSTGVHLPSLRVWYALGSLVDVSLYSLLALLVLQYANRKKSGGSL